MTAAVRGRPRDPGLDTAILNAALDLFVERGIAGMSIEQVAKRAGVGKPTVYRRWSTKELLVADAIEARAADGVHWPSWEDIDAVAPQEFIRRNIDSAARAAADPSFRALLAQVYGSAVSHPLLMQTYWEHHIVRRRELSIAMLQRAQADGLIPSDADLPVLVDMMVGAVTYRLLLPDPPTALELKRYLESVYRQVGLLD